MEWSVRFTKQLFALSHPVFMSPKFLFQIGSSMGFPIEILQTLNYISNIDILGTFSEIRIVANVRRFAPRVLRMAFS